MKQKKNESSGYKLVESGSGFFFEGPTRIRFLTVVSGFGLFHLEDRIRVNYPRIRNPSHVDPEPQ